MNEAAIWAEYERLGYKAGWVFAMTPLELLTTANTVVIGLNPGGTEQDSTGGCWQYTRGRNAYLDDRWVPGSDALYPIQVQVAALHALLKLRTKDVFAAQFIPFRSPRLVDLTSHGEALAFARKLWSWVLPQSPANLFICMGGFTAWHIADLLGANLTASWPTGWGRTQVKRYLTSDNRIVVELPHPSRYRILTMRSPEKKAMARTAVLEAATASPE